MSVSQLPAVESLAVTLAAEPKTGLRLRAFLVGIPLLIGICWISVYADMVSQVVQFGVLQFAPPAIAILFLLAVFNRGLGRLLKRQWLSAADIVVIYSMMLVGVLVSTRGLMERLIPPLAYLPYFATRENKFSEKIAQYLPPWAVPFLPTASASQPSDAMRGYWEGGAGSFLDVPWNVWVGPLCAWFGLFACVVWVFLCLATLLRRQWTDNEQLTFPLTTLPLAIIKNEVNGQPFFTNRLMWLGAAVSICVFALNGMAANNPDWPKFVTEFNLTPFMTERPWNVIEYKSVYMSLAAVGFAYFLPTDLLFSLWFFFLMTRVQDLTAAQMGVIPAKIVTHDARVWTGYQAAGAYIVLILAQIRVGWPYYRQVWRTAFGSSKPLDDTDEMMTYRAALTGVVVGFAGIILWLTIAGMSPWLAAAQMGIYLFVIALVMSRAVTEAGLLMTECSFLPAHLIGLVYPLPNLTPVNMSMLGVSNMVFTRELRGLLLTSFLDNQKMATSVGLRPRALLAPLALAVVVAFVAGSSAFLYFNYKYGALTLFKYANQGNPRMMYGWVTSGGGTAATPDVTAYAGLAVGVAVTVGLMWMRSMFSWFPLHPLGYAVAPTWSLYVFWFAFFVAWMVKSIILRFGGIDTYKRLSPFMLGLILGEFSMAVFWAIMNMWRGWSTPAFPWL
jgi:hypothetical protein